MLMTGRCGQSLFQPRYCTAVAYSPTRSHGTPLALSARQRVFAILALAAAAWAIPLAVLF